MNPYCEFIIQQDKAYTVSCTFATQHVKVRSCIKASQLKRFLFAKLSNANDEKIKVDDITFYFICTKGNRWSFDEDQTIDQLIRHEMWSKSVISTFQHPGGKPTQDPSEASKIFAVIGRRSITQNMKE